MRWTIPIAVAGFAAVGSADPEVFDLGKLDQYMSPEVPSFFHTEL